MSSNYVLVLIHLTEYVGQPLIHDPVVLLFNQLLAIEDTVVPIKRLLTGFYCGVSQSVCLRFMLRWDCNSCVHRLCLLLLLTC